MRTKFNGILTLLLAFVVQATFAQKTITGTVSDDMGPIPSASVIVKGTQNGTVTDFDGNYSITAKVGDVIVFSYAGMQSAEKTVGASNVINVTLGATALEEVVVFGVRDLKTKSREEVGSSQVLTEQDLGIGKDNNLKTALIGKISGVQVAAQSGTKLGSAAKVYLRGAISATGRAEAIYIVDGIETSADNVDMDNVASINVLKGPSAVALYGLRGANGVIVVTTKSGKSGKISVDVFNNTTFQNVITTMNYQNEYGQGGSWGSATFDTYDHASSAFYLPEWSVFDGKQYMPTEYVDESWGPKMEGQEYIPWYAWWQGTADNPNPYFGQTAKYEAQPNNVKDYYDTGVISKTGFAISGGNESATGRISYSRIDESGTLPYTALTNDNASMKFNVKLTEKLSVGANVVYNTKHVTGRVEDTYGTGTTGSFNQWFGRNLDVKKMRELKDLKTTLGHTASWNWWGPYLYGVGAAIPAYQDYSKATFWFNPYYEYELVDEQYKTDRLSGSFNAKYKINEHLDFGLAVSRDSYDYSWAKKIPFELQYNSAFSLYHDAYINSFSTIEATFKQVEFRPSLSYDTNLTEDINLNIYLGAETTSKQYSRINMYMTDNGEDPNAAPYGLVIPDVYNFSNSRENIKPAYSSSDYKSRSVFSRVKLGYKNFLTLTGDISNVWDSRYDIIGANNKNSFMFGSIGAAFVFSEFLGEDSFINYGKLRANYAEVGTTVSPYKLNPSNYLSSYSYNSNPTMFPSSTAANGNVKPATSAAYEAGIDLAMFKRRVKFGLNYFNEHRTDEILNTETSATTGVSSMLVNAGDVKRTGIEIELGLKAVKTENFNWNIDVNWSNPKSTVLRLAEGQERQLLPYGRSSFGVTYLTNVKGEDWGQIVGNAIKRDAAGNPVFNADGTYDFETNHSFGSVLPDFVGGVVNTFEYKGITLAGTISFQKGGKFFSLSEWWGNQTGLAAETAGLNDRGIAQRDLVANGGGVHIVGVDNSGTPVDRYIEGYNYYSQFYGPRLAEPFIHDASYIKLADLSISYKFPKSVIGNTLQGASIGVMARNLGMLSVSKENTHSWDPSEFAYAWGEDAGQPSTRSIGFNIKLTF